MGRDPPAKNYLKEENIMGKKFVEGIALGAKWSLKAAWAVTKTCLMGIGLLVVVGTMVSHGSIDEES
jgi:hypothetical protein